MVQGLTPIQRSEGIALKRGLTLLGMSFFVPGSAQIAYGNRKLGRKMFQTMIALVVVALLFGVAVLVARNQVIGFYANAITPQVIRFLVLGLGVAAILLLFNAWRISNPAAMSAGGRGVMGVVALVMATVMATGSYYVSDVFAAQANLFGKVFKGGGTAQAHKGRINVLLIGADSSDERAGKGVRTDSVTLASINAETGRTVLFGIARNTERVPFSDSSPLKKIYPDGFYCPKHECLMNAIHTEGVKHKNLYPGVADPGMQAVKEAVEGLLQLKINYYAMANLDGFENLIDALGGITLDIYKPVPVGGGSQPIHYWIQAGKNIHLDGNRALWFARSRADSSDYERMVRQKCVMNAMLRTMDPATVAAKFSAIASASANMLFTDVPGSDIGALLDLAVKGKSLPISSVNFTPPLINTDNPNIALIRSTVVQKIAESEALDKAAATAKPAPSVSAPAQPAEPPSAKPFEQGDKKGKTLQPKATTEDSQTDNLDAVCSVSGK